jgi:hypothetical protein
MVVAMAAAAAEKTMQHVSCFRFDAATIGEAAHVVIYPVLL